MQYLNLKFSLQTKQPKCTGFAETLWCIFTYLCIFAHSPLNLKYFDIVKFKGSQTVFYSLFTGYILFLNIKMLNIFLTIVV